MRKRVALVFVKSLHVFFLLALAGEYDAGVNAPAAATQRDGAEVALP